MSTTKSKRVRKQGCMFIRLLVLTVLFCIYAAGVVYAAERVTFRQAFPDDGFREAVLEIIVGGKKDNAVMTEEDRAALAAVETLYFWPGWLGVEKELLAEMSDFDVLYLSEVDDITGLEYFTGLLYLTIGHPVKNLDVSANTKLREIEISNIELTSLDVSNNLELEILNCSFNDLKELDVSKNDQLRELYCSSNDLIDIDVSNNPALVILNGSFNDVVDIDLSKNPALEILNMAYNELRSIDVSENLALKYIDISNNNIRSFDLSKHKNLVTVNDRGNKLPADNPSSSMGYKIFLDGGQEHIDLGELRIEKGHILIDTDFIFHKIGVDVDTDSEDGKIILKTVDERVIVFTVGSTNARADGKTITLDAAPQKIGFRYYIPLCEAAALCGEAYIWDEKTKTAYISGDYDKYGKDVVWFINSMDANGLMRRSPSLYFSTISFELAGGSPRGILSASASRNGLETAWSVTSRQEVFELIERLYESGHNDRYLKRYGSKSPWGERGVLAWDMCRIAQVAGHAYLAHYITFDEYVELALPAAAALQENFDGWLEMGENFLEGAAFWQNSSVSRPNDVVKQRIDAHEAFTEVYEDVCPPWDTALPQGITFIKLKPN